MNARENRSSYGGTQSAVSGALAFCRSLLFIVSSASCLLFILPPSAFCLGSDWPMYRCDASRSGYTAEALPKDLKLQWQFKALHAPRPAWPHPGHAWHRMPFDFAFHVVADRDRVYFGSSADCTVYALDAESGGEQWRFLAGGAVRFAPVLWKDSLFVVSDDGHLYCLSARDGSLKWKFYGGAYHQNILDHCRIASRWPARGGPVVENGLAYFGAGIFPTQGSFLYALDAGSGEVKWVNDTACLSFRNMRLPAGESFSGVAAQGHLVMTGDTLLVPTGRGMPGGFNPQDGTLRYFLADTLFFRNGGASVMAAGNWLFCGDKAYDLKTGDMICPALGNLNRGREHALAHPDKLQPYTFREIVAMPDGFAIATGREVRFTGRNPFGGTVGGKLPFDAGWFTPEKRKQLRSVVPTGSAPVPCEGAVIAAGGTVYAGGRDVVTAVDAGSKKAVWSAPGRGIPFSMAAARGRLYVSTDQGAIYYFSSRGGGKKIEQKSAANPYPQGTGASARAARDILKSAGIKSGLCMDLGCGDGRLAYELAKQSELYVYAIDTDEKNVEAARKALSEAGLYGTRVMVHHVESLETTPAPNCFANLVVSGRSVSRRRAAVPGQEAMRIARPFGGMVVTGPPGSMRKTVRGPLAGAGSWTHQYADAGNTVCSGDTLAGSPLGVLWFGSRGRAGMPHGWGRPPAPLFVEGRLFTMGINFIRCTDAYNGRVVWETPLKGIANRYKNAHYGGTYFIGANWCASGDSVFAHNEKECFRLDARTGKILRTFKLGDVGVVKGTRWGYVAFAEESLFLTADGRPFDPPDRVGFNQRGRTQGLALVALDPGSGRLRWHYKAKDAVWRDTVAIAAGRVFLIDRPADAQKGGGSLLCLDAGTGRQVWKKDDDVFGNMLAASEKHDALLMAYPGNPGGPMRGLKRDLQQKRMAVFRASTGEKLWDEPHGNAMRPVIIDRTVVTQGVDSRSLGKSRLPVPDAFDLLTGEVKARANPLSGNGEPWTFGNVQRCGVVSASERLLTYRTSDLTYFDLSQDEGTGNFGGLRPGCWINVLPVGGMVLAPDNWVGCHCSNLNRTTIALEPVAVNEHWALVHSGRPRQGVIGRVGLNLGAPGDRRDKNGTLWLAVPRPYPRVPHRFRRALDPGRAVQVKAGGFYRRHADLVRVGRTEAPWILASGMRGAGTVTVDVGKMRAGTKYRVRLLFAEIEGRKPRERVFDVTVGGRPVLSSFDIVKEAGAVRTAVVKEFTVEAAGSLTIALVPRKGEPVLSGVEIRPLTR